MLKKIILFIHLLLFTCGFSQENLHIKDYIRINDIGIKIIDKKKLKKDIEKLDISKDQLKALKSRLKSEEKEEKSGIKAFNTEVYKRRREEEYSIRATNQSSTTTDTVLEVSNDQLFAKRVDKVFDEEVVEEPELDEAEQAVVDEHPVVPSKRNNYPWKSELSDKPCDWDIYYVDSIERDTVFKSKTHLIFHNTKPQPDVPQADVHMFVIKENNTHFLEVKYTFSNLEIAEALKLTKGNTIRFALKNKSSVIIPFSGYPQKASISSDYKQQEISGRYKLSRPIIDGLLTSKWKSIHTKIGRQEFLLVLSKNFTSKAEKSDISELFNPHLSCIQIN